MKVLVADDDRDLLELIAFALSQAGYLVVNQCGLAANQVLTLLSVLHITFPRGSRALSLLQACTCRKIHQPGRFWMLFARLLRPFVTVGTLRIIDAGGLVHTIRGHDPGPDVTMRLHNRRVQRRLLWRPAMAVVKLTWTAA